jgi:hypothetical protein
MAKDQKVEDILAKTASYIEETQTELDKQAENRDTFIKRANQVAGVLANKGLINQMDVNAFVDKIAEDESGTEVWNLVEKLADAVAVDSLGGSVREKMAAAGQDLDPFEKLALYGDARADIRTPGMVD